MLNSDLDTTLMFSDSSSGEESSSVSFGESSTIFFGSSLPNMWYNVPDGLERNPDVIRAESSLLITPISQAYAAEAYGAVQNVQNMCASDYKTLCGAPSMDLVAVTNFLDNFMAPRLLTETQDSDGVKMVNYLRSYYRKLDGKPRVSPKHGAHLKPTAAKIAPKSGATKAHGNLRKASRGLQNIRINKQLLDMDRPRDPRAPPPPRDQDGNMPPPPHGPPRGPPPPGAEPPKDAPRDEDGNIIPPPRGPPPRGPPPEGLPPKGGEPPKDAPRDEDGNIIPPPRGPPPRGPPPPGAEPPKDAPKDKDGNIIPPPRGPPPRGPPPPPQGVDAPKYADQVDHFEVSSPESRGFGPPPPRWDESSSSHDDYAWEDEGPPPPPPCPYEDVYFNGALGYGANGDMCLYENFDQLSQPCVDSVAELYDVRQRFWHDSEDAAHGHHAFFWILVGLCIWFLIKKCIMRGRKEKMRSFMKAIHENPALKATIEAETGMSVPEMRCKNLRGSSCQEGEKECCLKRFCKCLITFVFVFVVSLFMAITSLEITMNIVSNMDADAQANGTEGPTPLTAMLVLLIVNLSEIAIFVLAVKAGKCLCAYFTGTSDNNDTEPSAPPASPRVVHVTSAPAPVVQTTPQPFWGRVVRMSNPIARMFTSGRVHGEYTALNGGEDETEMVTVVPSSGPQYSLTPVLLSNGQTVMTVSAAPVTKVNMV